MCSYFSAAAESWSWLWLWLWIWLWLWLWSWLWLWLWSWLWVALSQLFLPKQPNPEATWLCGAAYPALASCFWVRKARSSSYVWRRLTPRQVRAHARATTGLGGYARATMRVWVGHTSSPYGGTGRPGLSSLTQLFTIKVRVRVAPFALLYVPLGLSLELLCILPSEQARGCHQRVSPEGVTRGCHQRVSTEGVTRRKQGTGTEQRAAGALKEEHWK